jgi:bidirectional [NiFe] hydrogenase diaphorase subunit
MFMARLSVDDKIIEGEEGTILLQTCLNNDIYIPNLCYLEDVDDSPASCRMCFVEIGGEEEPVTSCKIPVKDNMVVKTDTPGIRELQRTALRLLLSVHHTDCKNCRANKKCELQRIAKFLDIGLRPKPLERYLKETDIDQSHPFLDYYSNRCVLCGKCIHACRKRHGQSIMTFAKRGFDTTISSYGKKDVSSSACEECYACIEICPVGALETRS